MNNKITKKIDINRILLFMIICATMFMAVGYAAINSVSLEIDSLVTAKAQKGVFITSALVKENSNADIDNTFVNVCHQTMLNSTVTLLTDNPKSSAIITISIHNETDDIYVFKGTSYDKDFYSNNNITFKLNGLEENDVLNPDGTIIFTIEFYYVNGNNISADDGNILNSYIDFNFEINTWEEVTNYGFENFEIINSNDGKSITANYTSVGGQYEKINLPLNNLEKGSLYQLTFTTSTTNTMITGTGGDKLVYGCTVMSSPITNFTSSSSLIAYDANNSGFLWKTLDSGEQTVTLSFWATAETMYWIWDLSRSSDKSAILYIKNISIEKTNSVSGVYVDFPNTTIYQEEYLGSDGTNEATLVISKETFITKASYNDLIVKMQTAGGFEFINIPLKGLTSGKTYTITFDNYTTGRASSWKYGSKVQASKQESGSQLVTDSDYLITDLSIVNSGKITFTSTSSTMYWVWDCGGISDNQWVDITLSNVTIN